MARMPPVKALSLLTLLSTSILDASAPEAIDSDASESKRKWCNRCRGTGDIGNSGPCPKCQGGKK